MKNILVITPHPDDLELGCSGTLMKFKDQGANIDSIITIKPSVEINANRNKEIVHRELIRAIDTLNINCKLYNTPLLDNGRPHLTCDNNTITQIESMLELTHYDLIITTDPGDYHQDHRNTFSIANSICRNNIASELWTMQISPYSHRNTMFTPNVFVDISDYMDRKIKAIKCYESYISDKILDVYKGLATYNSNTIKDATYVEAFDQKFRNIQ